MAGDIKAIKARIEGVNGKLDEMDKRLSSNDARLEDKVDSPIKKHVLYQEPVQALVSLRAVFVVPGGMQRNLGATAGHYTMRV
ncbi:MAG: hypothetical protein JRM85_07815 [Nitrososphaerota archaeon]|jgi:hypothetical protein|nr:hypothetical protein [Nitrososphaerota archaeon]MDG6917479.1 hypothetical protein [Nitrososphaerota archaeon]